MFEKFFYEMKPVLAYGIAIMGANASASSPLPRLSVILSLGLFTLASTIVYWRWQYRRAAPVQTRLKR